MIKLHLNVEKWKASEKKNKMSSLVSLRQEVDRIEHKRFKPLPQEFKGGTHGSVLFCTDTRSSEGVALKRIVNEEKNGVAVHALREVAAYKKLGTHVNILNLFEVISNDVLFFVLELMDCTLKNAIGKMEELDSVSYKRQILEGIAWCHEHKIMHRDIKPQNILLKDKVIKIADFGLAKQFSKCRKRSHSIEAVTLWYRALEILLGSTEYTEKIDIWSIGCVFYEMDHGVPLFFSDSAIDTIMQIYRKLGTPNEDNFPGVTNLQFFNKNIQFKTKNDDRISDHCKSMLCYNVAKRPSAKQMLLHFLPTPDVPLSLN